MVSRFVAAGLSGGVQNGARDRATVGYLPAMLLLIMDIMYIINSNDRLSFQYGEISG
jgi:hypothetical protein